MRPVHVKKSVLYFTVKKEYSTLQLELKEPVNNGQVLQTREQFIGYLV
jgi:hypothetical protein